MGLGGAWGSLDEVGSEDALEKVSRWLGVFVFKGCRNEVPKLGGFKQ